MIKLLKKLIFWSKIREQLILSSHKRTASFCRMLISECQHSSDLYLITPKKDFGQKRIIWLYWAQGFFHSQLPSVVKMCIDSIEKFCQGEEFLMVKLSDDNIDDYITIPPSVKANLHKYSRAFFSDFLRCALLSCYGGGWFDATVMLTDFIPAKYWEQELFLFQRSNSQPDKEYWENAFAFYYGWNKRFKVRMLSSIMFCHKHNPVIEAASAILNRFIAKGDKLPNYFFFQILFNELITGDFKNQNCEIVSDCIPHYLQQYINDPAFRNLHTPEEIIELTPIHKLTYKCGFDTDLLKQIVFDL